MRQAGFDGDFYARVLALGKEVAVYAYQKTPGGSIEHFIDGYNERAQPFVWTKTAEQILIKAIEKQDTSETVH